MAEVLSYEQVLYTSPDSLHRQQNLDVAFAKFVHRASTAGRLTYVNYQTIPGRAQTGPAREAWDTISYQEKLQSGLLTEDGLETYKTVCETARNISQGSQRKEIGRPHRFFIGKEALDRARHRLPPHIMAAQVERLTGMALNGSVRLLPGEFVPGSDTHDTPGSIAYLSDAPTAAHTEPAPFAVFLEKPYSQPSRLVSGEEEIAAEGLLAVLEDAKRDALSAKVSFEVLQEMAADLS